MVYDASLFQIHRVTTVVSRLLDQSTFFYFLAFNFTTSLILSGVLTTSVEPLNLPSEGAPNSQEDVKEGM